MNLWWIPISIVVLLLLVLIIVRFKTEYECLDVFEIDYEDKL